MNKFAEKSTFIQKFKEKHLGTLIKVDTDKKLAALTFDGGPDPKWTPKVLKLLDDYNAKATFFVIGEHVDKHPEIVRQTFEANHTIANHSWDHPCFPLVSRFERIKQIRKCRKSISAYDCKLFRPPFGHQNMASRFDAFITGYTVVGWDLHPLDWQDRDPQVMVKELNEGLHPGSIILLHDIVCMQRNRTRNHMLEALEIFLKENSDFQFLTLPKLLEHGKPVEINWLRKPNEDQKIKYGVI